MCLLVSHFDFGILLRCVFVDLLATFQFQELFRVYSGSLAERVVDASLRLPPWFWNTMSGSPLVVMKFVIVHAF